MTAPASTLDGHATLVDRRRAESDPDAALLHRVARGEPEAVRRLVQAKLPRILGLATRMLRDRTEAEDVAQEALLRTWRQAPRWRTGGARLETWLHGVVLNLCRDRLRSRRHLGHDLPEISDPGPDAETALLQAERGRFFAAAVERLPERQRGALLLVYHQGLSGAEAAARSGITVEALESLLSRARRTLRARMLNWRDGDADA